MSDVLINGVPFVALFHHDVRFIRRSGLFAFAVRDSQGRRTILHLELAKAINRRACGSHERWAWALSQGMNEVLVHIAEERAVAGVGTTVRFHPEALFCDGSASVPLMMEDLDERAECLPEAGISGASGQHASNGNHRGPRGLR